MAKRRRLDPMVQDTPPRPGPVSAISRPPIAEVAGEAARAASFEAVAGELATAREEGRLVLPLDLTEVDTRYLIRDRVQFDEAEMETLKDSLRARGQQTPIEVVDRGESSHRARYGLISGLRRYRALQALAKEDPARFGTVLALVRRPESAQEAYQAMVEENEIRASLSFYEKAHLALSAAEAGIYPDTEAALKTLFAAVSRPKRSKIRSFVTLVEALRGHLRFPAEIPEHLGLKLVKAIREERGFGPKLSNTLATRPPETAAEERTRLEAALKGPKPAKTASDTARDVAPGIRLHTKGAGELRLTGAGVTPELIAALEAFLAGRTGSEEG